RIFTRMRCENGVIADATDVRGVCSDLKHIFTLTVPKNATTVNCVRGLIDDEDLQSEEFESDEDLQSEEFESELRKCEEISKLDEKD
ncbi:30572_t:CDS:2, partial [Racocetra persica]